MGQESGTTNPMIYHNLPSFREPFGVVKAVRLMALYIPNFARLKPICLLLNHTKSR
jgi:hypothetical protein